MGKSIKSLLLAFILLSLVFAVYSLLDNKDERFVRVVAIEGVTIISIDAKKNVKCEKCSDGSWVVLNAHGETLKIKFLNNGEELQEVVEISSGRDYIKIVLDGNGVNILDKGVF